MRTSNAALALITRCNSAGTTEYLTQWNEAWQAFSLVGGHVEEGETFRQACVREMMEELNCAEGDIQAAPYPYATLRFCTANDQPIADQVRRVLKAVDEAELGVV